MSIAPKGTHRGIARHWQLGMSRNGNEQIGVSFELLDWPGTHVSWYGFFTEKTVERTLESMEIMGWDGQDVTRPEGLDQNEVSLVVEHETSDDGKQYARVRWINRPGGSIAMSAALEGQALDAFRYRMQGHVLARKQARKQTATTAQRAPQACKQAQPKQQPQNFPDADYGPSYGDDDIPF